MDGVLGHVVVVHKHTHAWVVAREGHIGELRVGGVEAVVGLAVEHVLLEVPVALLAEGAREVGGLVAVVQDVAFVVVLHDKAQIDERQVEVSGNQCPSAGVDLGNAAMQRVQGYGALLAARRVGYLDFCVLRDVFDGEGTAPVLQRLSTDGDGLEVGGILDLEFGVELATERHEVHGICGGQRNVVVLAIHREFQFRRSGRGVGIVVVATCCQAHHRQQQGDRLINTPSFFFEHIIITNLPLISCSFT